MLNSYEKRQVLLSGPNSLMTSSAYFVGDFRDQSVQIDTMSGSAITIQGFNDDGFRSSIATWSTLTAIAAAGMFTIDPGVRWIRVQRASADTDNTITHFGRS